MEASETICAEVQRMFKFCLQNCLLVYADLLHKYFTFLYLPQAEKSEVVCQNWMTCLFLA